MNKVFNKLIVAFWVADIMNLPFMEMFDTDYPLNALFYFIVFALWGYMPLLSAEWNKGGGNSGKDNSNS